PETNRGWGITMEPLRQAIVGPELRSTSLAIAGVVFFVLLMACANVASLMLARGAAQSRELAVRVALGARRWRLLRQLMAESLVLASLGGAAGIVLAAGLIRIAPALIPPGTLPTGMGLTLDPRVLIFAVLASLATAIVFGLMPALQSSRVSPGDALRSGGRGI